MRISCDLLRLSCSFGEDKLRSPAIALTFANMLLPDLVRSKRSVPPLLMRSQPRKQIDMGVLCYLAKNAQSLLM